MTTLIFNHAKVEDWGKDYDGPLHHAMLGDLPYHLQSTVKRFGKEGSAPAQFGTDGAYGRASRGFMGECYHPDTELLTEDGWKNIVDLVDNRYSGNFYSLNPATEEIELVKAVDWKRFDFDGELMHFTGRSIDLLVTPNHKLWLSYNGAKTHFTEASKANNCFSMYNQGTWSGGDNPQTIRILKKDYPAKAFMRFMGMYLGDGCVVHRKNQPWKQNFISISAKIDRKQKACVDCLTELGVFFTPGKKQTLIYDKNIEEFLSPLGKAKDKYIPNWMFGLSKSLLLELWRGLLETDGHSGTKYKCTQYFTISKQLADDVQRLLIHCGLSATIGHEEPHETVIIGIKTYCHEFYTVNVLLPDKKLWFEKIDHKNKKKRLLRVPYTGYVYDVTLSKNHILMVRRNGRTVWSSNSWDGGDVAFRPGTWSILGKALFPGAFGMAFASPRGYHRMACAIEDAGMIIHPAICWINGQSFPKATRINNQIEDSELAKQWEGHRYGGQTLKNSVELICVFQKPYEGRPIDNITQTGAGALNIDRGRISGEPWTWGTQTDIRGGGYDSNRPSDGDVFAKNVQSNPQGRWPGNLILSHLPTCRLVGYKDADSYAINRFTDGAKPFGGGAGHEFETENVQPGQEEVWSCVPECPINRLNIQTGTTTSGEMHGVFGKDGDIYGKYAEHQQDLDASEGFPSRFFYQANWNLENADPFFYSAKASSVEREAGLDGLPLKEVRTHGDVAPDTSGQSHNTTGYKPAVRHNIHPTVKPLSLLIYLAKLLSIPESYAPRRILCPFSGSGSEMIAAAIAGWEFVQGIEMSAEYIEIAKARWAYWQNHLDEARVKGIKEVLKKSGKPSPKPAPGQLSLFDF
jgi:site-specific DNA-methyltransferase (adenine-specific)